MQAMMMFDGQVLLPLRCASHRSYALAARRATYHLCPESGGTGYTLVCPSERWRRTFPSLYGAVAYIKEIDDIVAMAPPSPS